MKHLAIGARARRFVLELPLETPDGFGGVIRTYAAGPQLWGALEMVHQAERDLAASSEQAVTHRVRLRWGHAPVVRPAPVPHQGRDGS